MSMLWKDSTSPNGAGTAVRLCVRDVVDSISRKVASRGARAVNAIRNAELEVLKGERSGKVYHKPGTHGAATKATRALKKDYRHKLRGGQLYRASAPGEAPALRTGNLRMHWSGDVKVQNNSGGVTVDAVLESQEKYAYYLEKGKGMEPGPFVEKIKEKAEPEIRKIYEEPFT